MANLNFLQRSK